MRKLSLFLSLLVPATRGAVLPRQESTIEATYDEACNIGYCSIMGATIGGWGGDYATVSTLEQFTAAVAGSQTGVVILNGTLSGNATVAIGSSKSILGLPGSSLTGITLSLTNSRNVILRNLKITTPSGPAISVSSSRSVWVDHCDLSGSSSSLLSIIQGSDYMTISHNILHSQPASGTAISVGHSDDNAAQDAGKFHITFIANHIKSVGTGVSFRFGTGHVLNGYFEGASNGVNTLNEANVLVESSVFEGSTTAVFSEGAQKGQATLIDVALGGGTNTAPKGEMDANSVPYPYDWAVLGSGKVKGTVVKEAGTKLHFAKPIEWGEEEIAEREGKTPPVVNEGGHDGHAVEDTCED